MLSTTNSPQRVRRCARHCRAGVLSLLAAACLLWLTACGTSATAPPSTSGSTSSSTGTELPDQASLERQKLAAEIRSIEAATAAVADGSSWFIRMAPFLTVLVASFTLLATIAKDRSEARGARLHEQQAAQAENEKRHDARLREQQAAQAENEKRHDEALAATVTTMGADSSRLRLNAAAALAPVLRGEDHRRAMDLLPVLVANLRCESDPNVVDVLVNDLGLALRTLDEHDALPADLDLTRTLLRRLKAPDLMRPPPGQSWSRWPSSVLDLAFATVVDCDFSNGDLRRLRGFGADLSRSRFSRANLHEARLNEATCRRTQFHESRLVSATFKRADLTGAQFQRAWLQGAHFERATCLGVTFTQAWLADAWFCDSNGANSATFDDSTLTSLSRNSTWEAAHFSPDHRRRLAELSDSSRLAGAPGTTPAGVQVGA